MVTLQMLHLHFQHGCKACCHLLVAKLTVIFMSQSSFFTFLSFSSEKYIKQITAMNINTLDERINQSTTVVLYEKQNTTSI